MIDVASSDTRFSIRGKASGSAGRAADTTRATSRILAIGVLEVHQRWPPSGFRKHSAVSNQLKDEHCWPNVTNN
ncbi:MAG: hypothetical protein KAY37_17075, partial [Phycisphaerae bacterium]|nr:hypothetical protein [Phycisphaerae bacterium]